MGNKIPYRKRAPSEKVIAHLNRVRNRLEDGVAAFNAIFNQYKWTAKRRGYAWELTKEQFRELTQLNCRYCDAIPSNKKISQDNSGSYIYNGIDRVDNLLGYTKINTVSCCKICNVAKNSQSITDFKNWVASVNKRINE